MVVGSGLIAKSFRVFDDNDEVVIFASGVSNSQETDDLEFKREFDLVKTTIHENQEKSFIYFSTCSIYDHTLTHSAYIKHKLLIEDYIDKSNASSLILRLPNVVGVGGNQKTLLNYLINKVNNGEVYDLWVNAHRNFLDVEDVVQLVTTLIKNGIINEKLNISYPSNIDLLDLVSQIESFYNIKSRHKIVHKGGAYLIPISPIIIKIIEVQFKDLDAKTYVSNLIAKYYSKG